MPYEQILYPQYRDADPDGLIGLKGAMHYFQDGHTWFMHAYSKGNDVLPEQYGAAWVYTHRTIQNYGNRKVLNPWTKSVCPSICTLEDHENP